MEKGNKMVLALLITVVILIAVFSSFGLNLFSGGTPEVTLPTVKPSGSEEPIHSGAPGIGGGDLVVEVTPQTVQSVIATLVRPESYYREITLETFWGENGSAAATAKVWVDGGYTRVDTALVDGTVEHTIVGGGRRYRWYNNEREWFETAAEDGDADLMQHIPTYEDILTLDTDAITGAGYGEKGGVDCVYVEVADDELGYLERYWVSVERGLLVAAETQKGERTVMRVSAYSVEIPVRSGNVFALPDGTLLHVS